MSKLMSYQRGSTILQWKNYDSDISESFQDIRSRSQLFDVTLACSESDGRTLQAHRVILAAGSKFFQNIICSYVNNLSVNMQPFIFLKGINFEDLSLALDFLYTRSVSVPKDRLASFLQTAKELQLHGLDQDNAGKKTSTMNTIQKMIGEGKALAEKYAALNSGGGPKLANVRRIPMSRNQPSNVKSNPKESIRVSKKIKQEESSTDEEALPSKKRQKRTSSSSAENEFSKQIDSLTETIYITKEPPKRWTKPAKSSKTKAVTDSEEDNREDNETTTKPATESDIDTPVTTSEDGTRPMIWPPEKGEFIATLYEDNYYIGKVCSKISKKGTIEVDYMTRHTTMAIAKGANEDEYWVWPKQKDKCATLKDTVLGAFAVVELTNEGTEGDPVYLLKNYDTLSALSNNSKRIISQDSE